MSSGLYTNAFAKYGVDAFVPAEEEQKAIHNIIFPIYKKDSIAGRKKNDAADRKSHAYSEKCRGADPWMHRTTAHNKGKWPWTLVLDTTQIHIDAILSYLLAN